MSIERYNLPIKIFYANMLRIGLKFKVRNGELRVGGNTDVLTPVLQEEIAKRADHLVALLTPPPSVAMEHYFGRLLTLKELKTALEAATMNNDRVDSWPVNGGWLLTTAKVDAP